MEGKAHSATGLQCASHRFGAFFADDLEAVVEHATRSSVITHTHDEAIAGAIAVAVAVAVAFAHNLEASGVTPAGPEFLDLVLPHVPESEVRTKIRQARDMAANASVQFAVSVLGNGVRVSAQDTVPFALWCAAAHLSNYEEAQWLTVSGLGDRDTTCAIVGGIVASHTGIEVIPPEWLKSRELLPDWPFKEV